LFSGQIFIQVDSSFSSSFSGIFTRVIFIYLARMAVPGRAGAAMEAKGSPVHPILILVYIFCLHEKQD
jgi:hypothetical protein